MVRFAEEQRPCAGRRGYRPVARRGHRQRNRRLGPDDVGEDVPPTGWPANWLAVISRAAALTGRVNLFTRATGLLTYPSDRCRLSTGSTDHHFGRVAAVHPGGRWTDGGDPQNHPLRHRRAQFGYRPQRRRARNAAALFNVVPFKPHRAGLIKPSARYQGQRAGSDSRGDGGARSARSTESSMTEWSTTPARRWPRVRALTGAGVDLIRFRRLGGGRPARVVPAAIDDAGGKVDHFGMPIDPGNLMLLGHVDCITIGLRAARGRQNQQLRPGLATGYLRPAGGRRGSCRWASAAS